MVSSPQHCRLDQCGLRRQLKSILRMHRFGRSVGGCRQHRQQRLVDRARTAGTTDHNTPAELVFLP